VDGLFELGGGPLMRANQRRIVGFALKSRLPSIYSQAEYVHAGGLCLTGMTSPSNTGASHIYFVDRILKGAKPADLPVEQPTKFEFVINLKTAKEIGLTIPPEVLKRADQVVQ
jgi:putative tryptophan/tyrosine transport system substrate-binding protein